MTKKRPPDIGSTSAINCSDWKQNGGPALALMQSLQRRDRYGTRRDDDLQMLRAKRWFCHEERNTTKTALLSANKDYVNKSRTFPTGPRAQCADGFRKLFHPDEQLDSKAVHDPAVHVLEFACHIVEKLIQSDSPGYDLFVGHGYDESCVYDWMIESRTGTLMSFPSLFVATFAPMALWMETPISLLSEFLRALPRLTV